MYLIIHYSTYDYTIAYKPGKKHANTDALSHLLLLDQPLESHEPVEVVLLMETLRASPVTAHDIRHWTDHYQLLSKVGGLTQHGWEDLGGEEMKPYHRRYIEFHVQNDCILWGCGVVVPAEGQERALQQLHGGHPGISRMKSIARSRLWWPGVDEAIETQVRRCAPRQEY